MELIKEAFQEYNKEMELIYEQLTSLKESYSAKEYNLLLEGFWDKVKSIASAIGSKIGTTAGKTVNTVQKGAEYVHDLGVKVYDKGVELGKKASELRKELYAKISKTINNSIEAIKRFPGQVWDNLVAIYIVVSDELGEIYTKAKEKGKEWIAEAKQTIISVYNKMASKLSETYYAVKKWAQTNKEKFRQSLIAKQQEIQEAANAAKQSSFESIKAIGNWMSINLPKLKNKTIEVGKWIGYFTLGLLALPFYASFWAIVKLHDTGKELWAAMQNGIATLKKNLGESWDILVSTMKKSYSTERGKMQPAVATPSSSAPATATQTAVASNSTAIEIGKTYMYKGKEVKTLSPGAEGYTKIQPVGTNKAYAVKNSDLTEKTNDSYSYFIKRFGDFKY